MRTIDFSPLYRSVVGFDRLAALLDAAAAEGASGYPPYNIERTDENAYRIEIAVAGFRPEELHDRGEGKPAHRHRPQGRQRRASAASCIAAWPSAISSAGSSSPTTWW